MRSHTFFGHHVHLLGADLELHGCAQRAQQSGVQRLVSVRLGQGDVILETARLRFVELVQHAQAQVAIRQIRHHDAKAENIADLGKAQALFFHLFVDGVKRLFAAVHGHCQA